MVPSTLRGAGDEKSTCARRYSADLASVSSFGKGTNARRGQMGLLLGFGVFPRFGRPEASRVPSWRQGGLDSVGQFGWMGSRSLSVTHP